MKTLLVHITAILLCFCPVTSHAQKWLVKTALSKELKEISGQTQLNGTIYAISDKGQPVLFKLNAQGKLLGSVVISNVKSTNIEAVTNDGNNIYIGDVGDNNGTRKTRTIYKVNKKDLAGATAKADIINFTFADEGTIEKKKENNFDCEAITAFKGMLYLFTKDREDKETRLYVLPTTPGTYPAKFIASFNINGLVTDAAISPSGNELVLCGYHKGHSKPFIAFFNHFKGNNFFTGQYKKIHLGGKEVDWQIEGITYTDNNTLAISSEGGNKTNAHFYSIEKNQLEQMNEE